VHAPSGLVGWIQRARLSAEDRDAAMEALMLFPSWAAVRRYGLMLVLSVCVAALGLLENSTAVVVGAMMIAPMMAPIMGLAASLVMGWGTRLLFGVVVVGLSVVAAVALAWSAAAFLPASDVQLPAEVLSRSSPDVRDLGVALAAGAAGAYATVRRTMSGALPGVAVAVALVPPLATVGVLLGRGQPGLAGGAGLLFATNLFGIVLAAAVVFLVTGFVPAQRFRTDGHTLAVVLAITAVPTVVVGVLLTERLVDSARHARELRLATQEVVGWLGTGDELSTIELSGSSVQVNVTGASAPPPLRTLTDALGQALGRPTTVDLRWIPVREGEPAPAAPLPALAAVQPVVEDWLSGQALALDGLSYDAGTLVVRASGHEPPHTAQELTAALDERLGTSPPVSLAWTRTSEVAAPDPGETAVAVVRGVVQEWAATQPGTTLLAVEDTGSAIVATVTGTVSPDVAGVQAALVAALPERAVVVQWLPSAVLTGTTPSPSPVPPNPAPRP
jgi:uncharacterized hydrophobic protein (TIGR00271 family)